MNNDYADLFKSFDKEKAFDELAAHFYNRNFGTISKADTELLMFKFFMEALIQNNKIKGGNVIDYNACSDYKISQQLGITQQRVRNLKVKKELVYPQADFKWEQSLAALLHDESRMKIEKGVFRISIPDPNLFYAIQDFVEDSGGYVELHLNRKILDIPQEYMLQLAILLESQEEQQQILKYVNRQIKHENHQKKINKVCTIVKNILEQGANAAGILSDAAAMLSADNPFSVFLKNIF